MSVYTSHILNQQQLLSFGTDIQMTLHDRYQSLKKLAYIILV